MEGNNLNGFNMENTQNSVDATKASIPPIMPNTSNNVGLQNPNPAGVPITPSSNIPSAATMPGQSTMTSTTNTVSASSSSFSGVGPLPTPMPAFDKKQETTFKEVAPNSDISSLTSSIVNGKTTKKSNGGSGFVLFLLIIVLIETAYIGYDYVTNHSDGLSFLKVGKVQNKIVDSEENQNEELGDIENYFRPDDAKEELEFMIMVQGKKVESKLHISDEARLIYTANDVETEISGIENARYFVCADGDDNTIKEVYVSTSDYKAYRVSFENDEFVNSAEEIVTINNDSICNVYVKKEINIYSSFEPEIEEKITVMLPDEKLYLVSDSLQVSEEEYEDAKIQDAIQELNGISLVLDKDNQVSFCSIDGNEISKLVDADGNQIIAKEAFVVPIKEGNGFRYKYYILTDKDILCYTFNEKIIEGEDTVAVDYSLLPAKDCKFTKDSKYTNDKFVKYNTATLTFMKNSSTNDTETLKLSPYGVKEGEEKYMIYTLASRMIIKDEKEEKKDNAEIKAIENLDEVKSE